MLVRQLLWHFFPSLSDCLNNFFDATKKGDNEAEVFDDVEHWLASQVLYEQCTLEHQTQDHNHCAGCQNLTHGKSSLCHNHEPRKR